MRKLVHLFFVVMFCALAPAAQSQQLITSRLVSGHSGPILGVGDFNGDGRLDFLIPEPKSLGTYLMLQNPDGTFTAKALPNIPWGSVAVADLNGDGHADIVSVVQGDSESSATLTIALGNGNGTFQVQPPVDLMGEEGASVIVPDLNGDNKPDIAVTSSDRYEEAYLQTFLNAGDGKFRPGPTYAPPLEDGEILAVGDFNGDGKADLVIINTDEMGNGVVQILLGKGDGSFSPGAMYQLPLLQFDSMVVGVGDLNHDHRQDLVVVGELNSKILLGKGDGTFTSAGTLPTSFGLNLNSTAPYSQKVTLEGIYIGDLNKDGIPDVVVASGSSTAEVAVYFGKGNGRFSPARVFNIGGPSAPAFNGNSSIAFADFNRDGRLDVLSADQSAGLTIAYGDGHGGFVAPSISLSANPGSIARGDFNHDGILDLAVVNEPLCTTCPSSVGIFLGTGKGYLKAPSTYSIPVKDGVIAVGDVNGDGKLDIVVTRSGRLINSEYPPPVSKDDLAVLLGRDDGTFEAAHSYKLLGPPSPATYNQSAFLVDVNHDGKLDLVGDWGTALGKGNGQFAAPIPLPSSIQGIVDLAPADFDASGNPGLAIATATYNSEAEEFETPSYLYILDGNGNGSFTIKSRRSAGVFANVATADLNGDGLSDILYTDNVTQGGKSYVSLGVALSRGNDAFSTATYLIPSSLATNGILTGDFDRDGKTDVVLLGSFPGGGDIALMRGAGSGALIKTPQFYQGSLGSAVVADLNGDGAPDIAGTDTLGVTRILNTGHRGPQR